MNKVTSYLKNVGKSISYATIEVGKKKLFPEVVDFVETNEELFKASYSTVSNARNSIKKVAALAKNSQVYKDINTGIDNTLSDIKTGNFYNQERQQAGYDAAGENLAGGFDDFGDDFDFGDWGDDDGSLDDFGDFSDDSSSTVTKGDVVVVDAVMQSGNLSSQLISKTVANTSKNIISANAASTNMMMSQNIQLVAGIRTSIAGVHESINGLGKFAQETVTTMANTQSQFFTDSIAVMRESNAILKEMRDMQRNMYDKKVEESKLKDQYGDVAISGIPDLTSYAKAIFKNAKGMDKTGMMDMLLSDMGGSSMLGQFFTNPLGGAMTAAVMHFIPKDFGKQMASFSKSLTAIFPAMIQRLNKWKKDDVGGIRGFLGNLLGLDVTLKKSIDTSKYEKEAVPFDGLTRKAIIDVIPEHLSKIESLLSGQSQRIYDYETGKWVTAKDINKKKSSDYESAVKGSFSEISDEIKKIRQKYGKTKSLSYSAKKDLEEKIYEIQKDIFEGEEIFSPAQIRKNYENDDVMVAFADMLAKIPLARLGAVPADVLSQRQRYSKNMQDKESKGYDLLRKLSDDSKLDSHLQFDKKTGLVTSNLSGSNILNIKDKTDRNVLDYLREILTNVSFIRQYGGSDSNTGNTIGPIETFDMYSKRFNKERISKEMTDAVKKLDSEEDRYNKNNHDSSKDADQAAKNAAYEIGKNLEFSDLDEDDIAGLGKNWHLTDNKYMKLMNDIPGKSFGEKWKNAETFKEKEALMLGTLGRAVRQPIFTMNHWMQQAQHSMYNFLFKAETDELDDEGKDIKGYLDLILNKTRASFDVFAQKIDEKIITPLTKKFGLDEKWDKFKNKLKESKPGVMLREFGSNIKTNVFKDFGSIGAFVKDALSEPYDSIRYSSTFDSLNDKSEERIRKTFGLEKAKTKEDIKAAIKGRSVNEIEKAKSQLSPELLARLQSIMPGFAPGGEVKETGPYMLTKGEKVITNGTDPEENEQEEGKTLLEILTDIALAQGETAKYRFNQIKTMHEKRRANKNSWFDKAVNSVTDEAKGIYSTTKQFLGIKGETPEEQEKEVKKEQNKLLKTVGNIVGDMKGGGAATVSKMIIGGGLGLLSGVVGGPLIGAGVGAATSLIKNSETLNEMVFGKKIKDSEGNYTGEREAGGWISKEVQGVFKKYLPDAGKGAVLGTVASFLTPFGPLAGAAIGAGIGLAKNSSTMQEMLFGEENGLINKDRKEKLKKYLPKAALGAGAGILLGPFGLFGNMALGAGVGLLTGTEEFKSLIFGEDDGKGNRIGGLKESLQEHFIDPIKNFGQNFKEDFFSFIKESMIDPLNSAITPITSEIAFQTKRLVFGLPKWAANLFAEHIGRPFMQVLDDRLVSPIAKGVKSLFGNLFSRFKGLISFPFRAVGQIGEGVRLHQIKQGRDVAGASSASERLKFANKNMKNMGNYKYRDFDMKLANMSEAAERGDEDAKNWMHELTARTAMLAHGGEYFDKEVKRSVKDLNKVLGSFVKLGWLDSRKDKKTYNRIRAAIRANDIETAIAELSNIQKTRTGGPLDAGATDAINEFTAANKRYQVAKDNREQFKDINSDENNEWMRKNFGDDWQAKIKGMKASRLFDYARKEEARVNGTTAITKNDALSDPSKLITAGESAINATLEKIYALMVGNKPEMKGNRDDFTSNKRNNKFNKAAEKGKRKALKNTYKKKDKLKDKFLAAGLEFDAGIIDLLYENKDIADLTFKAAEKGVHFDADTVTKLSGLNLNKEQLKLLEKYPYVALSDERTILKYTDYTRNDHGTIFSNRFFGARHRTRKTLDDLNIDIMNQQAKDLQSSKDEGIKTTFTEYGPIQYIKSANGDWSINMSDADTKEAIEKREEDKSFKDKFADGFTGLKDSVMGIFNHNKEKDEEEKKEPWYKKLFNSDLGDGIGSKLKFGASILAMVTGIGLLKNLWDGSKAENGPIYKIGSAVGNAVKPIVDRVHGWFANEGEYADENKGFSGFLNNHVFPNLFTGINVIFKHVVPAVVKAFIVNIPTIVKAAIGGVSELLGFGKNKNANNNKLSANSIKGAGGASGSSITFGGGSNAPWLKTTDQQASSIATGMMTDFNPSDSSMGGDYSGLGPDNVYADTVSSEGGSTSITNTINNTVNATKQRINNSITGASTGEDQQAVIADSVYMFKKDKNGDLVPIMMSEVQQGTVMDFYTEAGAHYIYNPETGDYESELGDTYTQKAGLASRFAAVTIRGAAVGKTMGIVRLGSKLGKTKIGGGLLKGADAALSHTPLIKTFYKGALKPTVKAVGSMANFGAKVGQEGRMYNSYFNEAVEAGISPKAALKDIGEDITGGISSSIKGNKIVQSALNSNTGKKIVSAGSKVNAGLSKVMNWVESGLTKVFKNNWVVEKISGINSKLKGTKLVSALDNAIKTIVSKATSLLSKSPGQVAKMLGKLASKVTIILPLVLIVHDLTKGFNQADSILGIKDATFEQKLIAALANTVNNQLFFGFIDTSTVVEWCVDTILPLLNIDVSEFKAQRDAAEQEVIEYNKQHGTNYSTEEYLKKDTWTYKIEQKVKGAKDWVVDKATGAKDWVVDKATGAKDWTVDKVKNAGKSIKSAFGNWSDDDKIRKKLGLNDDVEVTMQDRLASGVGSIVAKLTGKDNDEMSKAVNGGLILIEQQAVKAVDEVNKDIGALLGFTDEKGNPLSMTEGVKFHAKRIKEDAREKWNNAKETAAAVRDEFSAAMGKLRDKIGEGAEALNKKMGSMLGLEDDKGNPMSLTEGVKLKIDNQIELARKSWVELKSNAKETWENISKETKEAFKLFGKSISKGLNNLNASIGGLLGLEDENGNPLSLTDGIKTTAKEIGDRFSKGWKDFKESAGGFFDGLKDWYNGAKDKLVDVSDKDTKNRNSGKGSMGNGFISQLDPKYKSQKFNIVGDTEYQTLGDSGCAPATAANVLNFYNGSGSIMKNASNAALKYKDINSGVTPDYFSDYLGKRGISTQATSDKQDMLSGIGSGQPTILLGHDPSNRANTPYGASSSHYVLATGLDGKGNVIIQDPESRKPNSLYPVNDVINQTQMGMITIDDRRSSGRGRRSSQSRTRTVINRIKPKMKNIGFGRGTNTINQDLGKWSPLSDSEIDAFIKRVRSDCPFTGKMINKAAKASGLDPRYILCHAAIESAWGTSYYGKKYHNYFGIGAFDTNPDNAKNYSNNGVEAGLIKGAVWIRKNFYDAGQKTLHEMRYSKSGRHNYCTSTTWEFDIARTMDNMPPNKNATFHKPDGSVTASSGNESSSPNESKTLFGEFSKAAMSYFNEDLINLIWGSDSPEEVSSGEDGGSDVEATGDAKAVVEIAKREVGTKASSGKHQKYGKAYGMDGVDWCAIFVWWVCKQAGCSSVFYGGGKSAYVPDILNFYRKKGQLVDKDKGQPGDFIIFDWSGGSGADHIGIIEKKVSGGYKTIEGNTKTTDGMVDNPTRTTFISHIIRPKYKSSGNGAKRILNNTGSLETTRLYSGRGIEINNNRKYGNVAAAMTNGRLSGRGSIPASQKYLVDRFKNPDTNTSEISSNSIYVSSIQKERKFANPFDALVTEKTSGISGMGTGLNKLSSGYSSNKGSGFKLPSLSSSTTTTVGNPILNNDTTYRSLHSNRPSNGNSNNDLLMTIIEILKIIACNSEKLSEVVSLLSRALDLNLTKDDISNLKNNNTKMKNKLANALKSQGSKNGFGESVMRSKTESLAAAMYSIARA